MGVLLGEVRSVVGSRPRKKEENPSMQKLVCRDRQPAEQSRHRICSRIGGGAAEGGDGPLAELSEKHKRAGGNIREAAKGR